MIIHDLRSIHGGHQLRLSSENGLWSNTGVPPRSGANFLRKFSKVAGSLACAGIFAASGCQSTPHSQPISHGSAPSIILIVIDTMRADRLGTNGNRPSVTPTLDRLAKTSLVFEQAQATAPFTMPSMASLMTGRYPDQLGIRNHSVRDRLPSNRATLAELARARGYRTAAVVTNPWLARRLSGFRRGFDRFVTGRDNSTQWRMSAARVTDAAVKILNEGSDKPLLLWVHFMDTHMPYQASPRFAAKHDVASVMSSATADFENEEFDRQALFFGEIEKADLEQTRALYGAAVETVDHEIARILATLDEEDIVIIAADHGESLGDHGLFFAHDFTLYQELLHVPLIVRLPDTTPGRVRTPVSLLDVLPTLCRSADLDCPTPLDGRPLAETPGTTSQGPRDLFSVSAPLRDKYERCPFLEVPGPEGRWSAVRRGDHKLIRIPTRDGLRYEAYDLADDPSERRNLYDPVADTDLTAMLDAWFEDQLASAPQRPGSGHVDSDTLRELRALGYSE
jgi:arylsulfatase A-like enzyme